MKRFLIFAMLGTTLHGAVNDIVIPQRDTTTTFLSVTIPATAGRVVGFGPTGTVGAIVVGTATDTLWNAAGDLAVGTGADTATRLPKGTALQVLRVNAGATALEWATPSSDAPTDATYITQTANGSLSAEQALGALATGVLKNTTTTGVLSIAAAGTDYVAPGGAGGALTLDASGFNGNLTTTDNTLQEVAQKLDDLTASGAPGGSDTHVQYNDGGVLGGEAGFTYNKTTNVLTVPNLTSAGTVDLSAATVTLGTLAPNSIALTTDTTGNYAAGDAEAGAALTGDSATAFFTTGTVEEARIDSTIARDSEVAAVTSDTAFASSWNAVTTIAPSKNAVYDVLHIGDTDDDGKIDVLDIISAAGFGAFSSGGVPVQGRTLTGTANQIGVTNGTGASGDPVFSLVSSAILPGSPTVATPGTAAGSVATIDGTQILQNKDLTNANNTLPAEWAVAVSDETTALTTGTAKVTFRMPFAMTLTEVRASVGTAPTGSTIIVDINEGGSTIMTTTKLTIDATEKTSTTATPAVLTDTALADDAEMTIDITQIGSTIAGAGLKVLLKGTR